MDLVAYIKPKFWDHVDKTSGPGRQRFDFRKIWQLMVFLSLIVALVPLVVLAVVDYRVTRSATESEILLRTARLVSNTRRSVDNFLAERKAALAFVNMNEQFDALTAPGHLDWVLKSLKKSFGGFVDLGVINDLGIQVSYAGPYDLHGMDYSKTSGFKEVVEKGGFISDVFRGFRDVPHMVIAVKHDVPGGRFYVLRATLDTARFNALLSGVEIGGEGDAFVINEGQTLQTQSRFHGNVLDRINLPVPAYSDRSQVEVIHTKEGEPLILGYAYIPHSPFILMIVKHKAHLMASWRHGRNQIIVFLSISVVAILLVLLGGITYLVNQIYVTEQHRVAAMQKAEYANKLASLGRLSAGVAHEINNPLAIINEKAGLIKDLFALSEDYEKDEKLMGLIDAVLKSVERCSGITRRLLNFARHSEAEIKQVDLKQIVQEVLGFMEKEAEYRSIHLDVHFDEDVPEIESDPGQLQQIFLNLISNAFAAVQEEGRLDVTGRMVGKKCVEILFTDDGYGIPEEDLERIFEPFYSTKTSKGGTGLGLSITYRLIQELGGTIGVNSRVGIGTTFTVRLPVHATRWPGEVKGCEQEGMGGL
ncbi:MAG: ATP-binding protein [Deltaproteobacteria bacterium]